VSNSHPEGLAYLLRSVKIGGGICAKPGTMRQEHPMKPDTAVMPQNAVLILMLEAAIQKLDQGQPELARELLTDLVEKLKPESANR
jgi:hypothetical protein